MSHQRIQQAEDCMRTNTPSTEPEAVSNERLAISFTLFFFVFITTSAVAQTEAADAIPAGENSELPAALDPDRSGTISIEEFKAMRRARAFANDTNGDGTLSLDEFRTLIPSRVPKMMHGRIFRRIDGDGSGSVDGEEFDATPVRAFDEADVDGNGELAGGEIDALRTEAN